MNRLLVHTSLALALATMPSEASAEEQRTGVYVFGGTGLALGDTPVRPAWMLEAGAGGWLGFYDRQYLSGRYIGLGPTLRGALSASGLRLATEAELRVATELILGGVYVFAAGGPLWTRVGTDTAATGWTSRAGIGGKLLVRRRLAVSLRLGGGVERVGGTTGGHGELMLGVERF